VPVPVSPKDTGGTGGKELDHVIVVRAYDRFDNMSSAKTVIRGK